VPHGTSRLRVTLRANHRREEVDHLCELVAQTLDRVMAT